MPNFFEKLEAAARRNDSLLCVGLDPVAAEIPERFASGSDGVAAAALAWNLAVIDATHDLVCCYKPNIAFYEAMGAAGMATLQATLAAIPHDVPVLLDAKRGDMGPTAVAYAKACFEVIGADAVTLSPYLGRDSVDPFFAYADRGIFVLAHTSNPSAPVFQETITNASEPLYLQVAREATSWSPNVGLVVGATYPEVMAGLRAVAPDRWFLVPGIGAQGGEIESNVLAGLRADGLGMLLSASRGIAGAQDIRAAALATREAINQARQKWRTQGSSNDVMAKPDESMDASLANLVIGLADLGAVKFGNFTLASGTNSPVYIDLRLLVSQPQLLEAAALYYAALLEGIECERICGVPYAALPIGTALALHSGKAMIYPRKELKQHGLGKQIEGAWLAGDRVVIVEDLITSAGSIIKSAELLRAEGMIVEDAIVLIDREQGGMQKLAAAGIRGHAVMTFSTLLDLLVQAGRLDGEKRAEVQAFLLGGAA